MYVFRNGMIAGNEMALPIGKIGNDYPTRAGESPIIWNWTDNGHDFCFDLWELLGSPYQQTGDIGDEAEGVIYEKAWPSVTGSRCRWSRAYCITMQYN